MNSEDIIRKEFINWLDDTSKDLTLEDKGYKNVRKYYVYALCEERDSKAVMPFYIGKGTDDRVWQHTDDPDNDPETISEKNKKIEAIGKGKIKRIIVKSGLTEYEAYMCESALINLLRMDGIFVSNSSQLTNKQNGRSNSFERKAGVETSAITVETYYENYCKQPIILAEYQLLDAKQREQRKVFLNDFGDKQIILRNINDTYKDLFEERRILNEAELNNVVKEAVSGYWYQGDPQKIDYVFAMFEGRIKGIFEVKKLGNRESFFPVYDLRRDDHPEFVNLPSKVSEYNFANTIYNDLVSQGYLDTEDPKKDLDSETKKELFSKLSEKTKGIIIGEIEKLEYFKYWKQRDDKRKKYGEYLKKDGETLTTIDSPIREQICNDFLNTWSKRKCCNLSNVEDVDCSKYLNCSILEARPGESDSISVFAGKKTEKSRAYAKSIVYLDLRQYENEE